jgi:hypothetical protein
VFTLAKRFDDEGEVEEAEEEDIDFSKREKILRKPLSRRKSALDFVALLVERAVVYPGLDAVGLWRNHRDHAQAEHQLPGVVTLVAHPRTHRRPPDQQDQRTPAVEPIAAQPVPSLLNYVST